MGEEWSGYAHRRKPLRVISPSEEQRGSYYLQLPYRWSVPLLVCSGLLHWLVSQSIFLARVIVLDSQENVVPGSISTWGYSPIAIIFAICLGALLVLIGIICGFRKSKGGMHFAGSCSGAVSAACRPPKSDVNASMKPVMWGVVENEINRRGEKLRLATALSRVSTFLRRFQGSIMPVFDTTNASSLPTEIYWRWLHEVKLNVNGRVLAVLNALRILLGIPFTGGIQIRRLARTILQVVLHNMLTVCEIRRRIGGEASVLSV